MYIESPFRRFIQSTLVCSDQLPAAWPHGSIDKVDCGNKCHLVLEGVLVAARDITSVEPLSRVRYAITDSSMASCRIVSAQAFPAHIRGVAMCCRPQAWFKPQGPLALASGSTASKFQVLRSPPSASKRLSCQPPLAMSAIDNLTPEVSQSARITSFAGNEY